jgi:valyl-tRNA synthetase
MLTLPRCSRSGGVVEPMISTQWFVRMRTMADRALDAVHSGRVTITPAEWTKTYDHFLENIQDWCVSRQLWWGHQIPAWYGPNGEIRVARQRPDGLDDEGPQNPWRQDPDVLDTWFSSALWPFSTLGWPEATPALAKFYPASDLETGYDILFFWVARMMMFGIHFTGDVPFRRILLHGLVVDETGEKMSKVKGNVIDPLDLVNGKAFADMAKSTQPGVPDGEALAKFRKAYPSTAAMGAGFAAFGADAVRFTLATYPPSNKRIALAPKRIEGNRHFLNKIWNATRLALELLGDYAWREDTEAERARLGHIPATGAIGAIVAAGEDGGRGAPRGFYNRWVRSRFAAAVERARDGFDGFRIDEGAQAAYHFFWDELCPWYLELVKPILRHPIDGDAAPPDLIAETQRTLAYVIEGSLRLMHPFMPFITEELWQRVPRPHSRPATLALAPYPMTNEEGKSRDAGVDEWMDLLQSIVSAARTIRSEHGVEHKTDVPMSVRSDSPEVLGFLRDHGAAIRFLVKTRNLPQFMSTAAVREAGTTVSIVPSAHGPIEVIVTLKGLVDADSERSRIEREVRKIDKELAAIDKKLASPGFADRAPKEVVDEAIAQRHALAEAKLGLAAARRLADEL